MSDKELFDGNRRSNRDSRRDSRHSTVDERHYKNGSNHRNDRNERYDRNDRHRRHDNRSRDSSDRSDRRDSHRRDHRSGDDRRRQRTRSRSRSRSKERERYSSTRREDNSSRTKSQPTNETLITASDNKDKEKGFQQKNSLEIMRQQIKVKTGIDVPEYYNPGAINPIKYAEQQRKRNLLWSKEEKPEVEKPKEEKVVKSSSTSNLWNSLKFEGEKGNEMTEKFRKLMGIRDKEQKESSNNSGHNNESVIESQKTLFRNLDMQYSVARLSAHTQRGVGLGFGGPQNYSSSTGGEHK